MDRAIIFFRTARITRQAVVPRMKSEIYVASFTSIRCRNTRAAIFRR